MNSKLVGHLWLDKWATALVRGAGLGVRGEGPGVGVRDFGRLKFSRVSSPLPALEGAMMLPWSWCSW